MLKKILGTIGTRYLIALLSLALIFVNAKVLGVDGVGLVGLIIASVSILVILNGILAGNTLIYFMSRYTISTLILISYGWTFLGSIIGCSILFLIGLLPTGYEIDIFLLAILNSLVATNARFLLGKDNVKGFNLVYALQGGLLFFILLWIYFIIERQDAQAYLWGMYLTNIIALIASLILLIPYLKKESELSVKRDKSYPKIIKEMFAYGLWAGTDNLAEILTNRLNYFFIQRFSGMSGVGLLDAGTKISESVWHISRSVSFIEYSEIAKTTDEMEQKRITLQLFKLTFCALAVVIMAILCIPEWIFTDYLFTAEFAGIKTIINNLAIGIVAYGSYNIISHYFIGSGHVKFCTLCSCFGLITLLIVGYLLIPTSGAAGAAISCSIAYSVMLIFSIIIFIRLTHTRAVEFLPNRSDWDFFKKRFLRK